MSELTAKDLAQTQHYTAAAEAAIATADYQAAQAEHERILVAKALIDLDLKTRAYEWAKASDTDNRIFHFNCIVDGPHCEMLSDFLSRSSRVEADLPVEIRFNTPGGSAFHGMALYDEIVSYRDKGLHVITTGRGVVASMGAILLQAGTERRMGRHSTLLIHKLSVELVGSLDEIQDTVAWMEIIQAQSDAILLERSSLTKAQLAAGIKRKNWTLSPEEALSKGLIDTIG